MARPKRKCNKPACTSLIDYTESYCEKHKTHVASQYNNEVRYNKDNRHIARFYSSYEWKSLRNSYKAANPLCERCFANGRVTSAKIVHHKIEVREDFSKRLDWENLESICQACHNAEHKKK